MGPNQMPPAPSAAAESNSAGAQRIRKPLADRGARPGVVGAHALDRIEARERDRIEGHAPDAELDRHLVDDPEADREGKIQADHENAARDLVGLLWYRH